MTRTEMVISDAMAAVAASRAARERDRERRQRTFGRIDIAAKPRVLLERGIQLELQLLPAAGRAPN